MNKTINDEIEPEGAQSRQGIQVIERAADILRALLKNPAGSSLGEIATEVRLPRSTVQRIVDALAKESLVIAATSTHGVRLGPALIALGAATHFPIADLARPTIESLARRTGETVDLSITNRDHMVFLDQVPGTHRLAAVSAIGVTFPLHCSANGKAAMALMNDAELRKIKKNLALSRHTKNTITRWDMLSADLAQVRKTGLAYDREENSIGICAIAKAFRSPNDELVAVSIPVPTVRFSASEADLVKAIEIEFNKLTKRFE